MHGDLSVLQADYSPFLSHSVPSLLKLLPDWSVCLNAACWAAATVAALIYYCKTKTNSPNPPNVKESKLASEQTVLHLRFPTLHLES